jgi:hypothetical protein
LEWKTKKAAEITKPGYRLKTVVEGSVGTRIKEFHLPKCSGCKIERGHDHVTSVPGDDFLEFLGYWISEGYLLSTDHPSAPYIVGIGQKKPEMIVKMQACFDRLGWKFSYSDDRHGTRRWTWSNRCLSTWLREHCGGNCYDKKLPSIVRNLDPAQGQILFSALVDGDGSRDPRPNRTGIMYASTSEQLAGDVQALALSLGYRASVKLAYEAGYATAYGRRSEDLFSVNISRRGDAHFNQTVKKVPYKGKVYCFSVPGYGFFVTRRNGKVAVQGNSAESALDFTEHQVFSHLRKEFDWIMNRMILPSLGVRLLRFRTKGAESAGLEEVGAVLNAAARAGYLSVNELRSIASKLFNHDLKVSQDEDSMRPMQLKHWDLTEDELEAKYGWNNEEGFIETPDDAEAEESDDEESDEPKQSEAQRKDMYKYRAWKALNLM